MDTAESSKSDSTKLNFPFKKIIDRSRKAYPFPFAAEYDPLVNKSSPPLPKWTPIILGAKVIIKRVEPKIEQKRQYGLINNCNGSTVGEVVIYQGRIVRIIKQLRKVIVRYSNGNEELFDWPNRYISTWVDVMSLRKQPVHTRKKQRTSKKQTTSQSSAATELSTATNTSLSVLEETNESTLVAAAISDNNDQDDDIFSFMAEIHENLELDTFLDDAVKESIIDSKGIEANAGDDLHLTSAIFHGKDDKTLPDVGTSFLDSFASTGILGKSHTYSFLLNFFFFITKLFFIQSHSE